MQKILTELKNHIPITKKTTLIVSVSGGSDSMALVHMLKSFPAKIVVVHFNHLQREQSYEEAKMVEAFALENNFNYHYYTLELSSQNFQHQAHKLRRHYLKEVANIHKTPYILTAHHLDDLLESVLIKMTKGSNLLGYAGMQYLHEKEGYVFIKPLLFIDKNTLMSYIKKHDIPYMEDVSNTLDNYLRNRYRHTIIPIMKQENPNLLEQAQTFNYQLTQAFDYIRKQTLSFLNHKSEINLKTFNLLDEALKDDILAYLIETNHLKANYRALMKIKAMLMSKKPNQTFQLSPELHFIKAYDKAYVKSLSSPLDTKIKLNEGLIRHKNVSIFTFFEYSDVVTEDFNKLCYNKLAFPLWIRHKNDGDVLVYDYGHKKLKKLLIDQKIPVQQRKNLWILTDNNDQILWVSNLYSNQTLGETHTLYFKISEDPNA